MRFLDWLDAVTVLAFFFMMVMAMFTAVGVLVGFDKFTLIMRSEVLVFAASLFSTASAWYVTKKAFAFGRQMAGVNFNSINKEVNE